MKRSLFIVGLPRLASCAQEPNPLVVEEEPPVQQAPKPRETEEQRKKVAEEYQAQLKNLKLGEMPPIMALVPGPIHRPNLRSEAAKERQSAERSD